MLAWLLGRRVRARLQVACLSACALACSPDLIRVAQMIVITINRSHPSFAYSSGQGDDGPLFPPFQLSAFFSGCRPASACTNSTNSSSSSGSSFLISAHLSPSSMRLLSPPNTSFGWCRWCPHREELADDK
mmetsp:Transcript_32914/g.49821  ORF Transcript_32914/g.49821 Transcript_32914/m.49821 type:complete len:131 (-) Transcript_32914:200-592(-)